MPVCFHENAYPDEFGETLTKSGDHILVTHPEEKEPMDLADAWLDEFDQVDLMTFTKANLN